MGADAVIQLVTRCGSAQEFIERFARFTTATHVIVPALPKVSVGTAGPFVIRLKDQTVMMQGRCEVTEIRPVPVPPGGAAAHVPQALMSLRLVEMDAHSCGIHLRLMERHAAVAKPSPSPPPAPAPVRRTPARALSLVPPLQDARPAGADPRPPAPAAPPPPAPAVSTMQVMSIPRPPPRPRATAPLVSPAAHATVALAAASPPEAAPALEGAPPEIAIAPRPETRVAGADFTLPANPLSELDAADLSRLIDVTLLETTGNDIADGDTAAGVDTAWADPAASVDTAIGDAARGKTAGGSAPSARETARIAPLASKPKAHPENRLDRAERIARRWGPYAACVLAGVLLGIALKPASKKAPAPPAAAPAVVASPGAALPSPASAPAAEHGAPAARDCTARVTSKPAGAVVFWGELAIGSTPIDRAAIPCGTAIVTFRRERYAEATETITANPGQGAVVAERLYRPPAKLMVSSSPPHALIKLNRHRLGPAPRKVSVMRYEHIRLEASLPGYRPWKKTVYLKEPESTVDIALVPLPRAAARRPPPAAPAPARAVPPPPAAPAPARAVPPPPPVPPARPR
jgi:hypothetical protein